MNTFELFQTDKRFSLSLNEKLLKMHINSKSIFNVPKLKVIKLSEFDSEGKGFFVNKNK